MKYTVVYIAEVGNAEDGTPEVLRVSSQKFDTPEQAKDYANGIAPSRLPRIAEVSPDPEPPKHLPVMVVVEDRISFRVGNQQFSLDYDLEGSTWMGEMLAVALRKAGASVEVIDCTP